MKTRTNSFSGLDFQREYLSVAQYFPDEKSVSLVAIQPLEEGKGGNLWDRITAQFKELKGKFHFTTPDVVCALPSEYAVVKRIRIDEDEEDVQVALEWELSQQVIGLMDDYAYDFEEVGGAVEDNLKEFLVVAYRKEIVQRIASMTHAFKLNPLIVDLDIFALINAFELNYDDRLLSPSLLIHGESELTKLILSHNGKFLDFTTFEYDFSAIDAAAYSSQLLHEMNLFLSVNKGIVAENQVGKYLSGSLFSQPTVSETVIQAVPGAEILNPFRKIGCHVGIEDEQLKDYSPQLAVAVGLAIRGSDHRP